MDKKQQENFIQAFINNDFNITNACKTVNISRQTFYNNLYKLDDFRQELDKAKEQAINFVESALMEQIATGNTQAIIFYLKTKGKKYGYDDKEIITCENNRFTNMTLEQSLAEAKKMGVPDDLLAQFESNNQDLTTEQAREELLKQGYPADLIP
jgi:predicted DNA-binding protein YlxM (UPF0122 family)